MQKQQFVIKGLFFGLFGIIAFSSSAFAAIVNTNEPTTLKPKSIVGTITDVNSPTSLNLPVDQCLVKSQSDGKNAEAGLTACKERYKDNPTNLAGCDTQYAKENKMILDTLAACQASADGTNGSGGGVGSTRGITINPECLKNGQCGFNIYEFLGFEGKSNDPTVFVQDILLSASFFIGTVITIALIYSGFLFVTAGISGNSKSADSAKNGIKYSIIGLLIVICSYSLIRLVQYIAKGL